MYSGVPCQNNATLCCYNPNNELADNGAYPFGDLPKFPDQMTNPYSLTPFPNAIFFNWATIFVLGKNVGPLIQCIYLASSFAHFVLR